MKLYLVETVTGDKLYIVASSMEIAVRSVGKPFRCELVADNQYWDSIPQLKILG